MHKISKAAKLLFVLILSFTIGLNSISAGTLFAEQQLAQEQTVETKEETEKAENQESTKKDEPPAEQAVTKSTQESAGKQQPAAAAQPAETPAPKESAVVTIGDNGWSESVDAFNLAPSITVPSNTKGNTLTIHLPRYIELAAEIVPGGYLQDATVTGKADDEAGTTIVMHFADSGDGSTVMGKDIRISQRQFIEKSMDDSYQITATYSNASGDTKSNHRKYTPDILANKITGVVKSYYDQDEFSYVFRWSNITTTIKLNLLHNLN